MNESYDENYQARATTNQWRRWVVAALAVAVVSLMRVLLWPALQEQSPLLLFTLAVMTSAWYGGLGPGLLATALSALVGWYFFIPVYYGFSFADPRDAVRIGLFALIGVAISYFSEMLHKESRRAATSERVARGHATAAQQSEEQLRENIAERQRVEESLRKWQFIFDNASWAVATVDPVENTLQIFNPAFARMHGYTLEELRGRPLADVFAPESQGELPAHMAAAQEQGDYVYESLHLRKDGSVFPALTHVTALKDDAGNVLFRAATFQDITERKRAEESMRESEEQFRTLANSIPQLAWMADASGSIFWYSQRWYDYTGTTLTEMEGWGWQKVHHPNEVGRVVERFKNSVASGEPWEDTFPLRSHDGEYRHFLSRALPIRDAEGHVVRWFGTNTDIEEQLRAEEEREHFLAGEQAARREAEAANRLKDEFLATVSHELRTPLTSILGWSRLLQTNQLDEKVMKNALNTIERNARVQNQLIEDLMDVSRIITGKFRLDVCPVQPLTVIRAAIEAVRPAAEAKDIRLQSILDPNASTISGDPGRLQQIVWNLLSNAIKFTPKGGRVQVRLERINSHVEIIVSDTGQGITAEFLPFVFDRFRQADGSTTRQHGGLGLGLAIARQLVEMHGGTVSVASDGAGRGATFTVKLPLMIVHHQPSVEERRHPQTAAEIKHDCPPELDGVRVLVVDDEPDALQLLTVVLERCGAKVLTASSAAEALRLLEEIKPEVLLSDIGMPDEDGYSLIRKIRLLPAAQGGRTPAAALTAYASMEDRRRVLLAGFQMHIPKPVEPTELITVVASLAGRIGATNQEAGGRGRRQGQEAEGS